jgi:hypothetical protein
LLRRAPVVTETDDAYARVFIVGGRHRAAELAPARGARRGMDGVVFAAGISDLAEERGPEVIDMAFVTAYRAEVATKVAAFRSRRRPLYAATTPSISHFRAIGPDNQRPADDRVSSAAGGVRVVGGAF